MPDACGNCAAPLKEGAFVCAQCGAPAAGPPPANYVPTFASGSNLEGIGGWLILVAIGLAIAPLRSIHGVYASLRVLYGSQFEHLLSVHRGLAGLILYEAATNTCFLIALATLNYLFYRKKKVFPSLMINYFALQAALILIDHLVTLHFYPHHSASNLISAILAAAIWIPYYLRSERVKATFVN